MVQLSVWKSRVSGLLSLGQPGGRGLVSHRAWTSSCRSGGTLILCVCVCGGGGGHSSFVSVDNHI